MDNPTPAAFQAIRASAEAALQSARDLDDEGRLDLGAINWSDLRVVEVLFCRDEAGGGHKLAPLDRRGCAGMRA